MARRAIPARWMLRHLSPDRADRNCRSSFDGARRSPHRSSTSPTTASSIWTARASGAGYSRSPADRRWPTVFSRLIPARSRCREPPCAVAGTPFDFRAGFDDRRPDPRRPSAVAQRPAATTIISASTRASGEPSPCRAARCAASGRVLELLTDQPGLQVYSGNFLDGSIQRKAGPALSAVRRHLP